MSDDTSHNQTAAPDPNPVHGPDDAAATAFFNKIAEEILGAAAAAHTVRHIGPYRLLSLLGEGGFGVVFAAEQTEPVHLRVALKVIKPGMDSHEVIARFEAERQALAMMQHPGIARFYAAGTTERGLPYFAMELVKGVHITTYCDERKLTIRRRLELFAQVCDAVQHAHTKGVIHRDLKPQNILVREETGDRPLPVIIDFGIAKALNHRLTAKTLFTERGKMIGTPEYMSPEQARVSGLDVDTRTDIYSLGVLLYELLSGALPFESRTLREAGFEEVCRIIREVEPPSLSTRLSTLGDKAAEVARRRSADMQALARVLNSDLQWVVHKALKKERDRRYGTVAEFAADVRNHLAHRPTNAAPDTLGYRFGKFLHRNRASVATAAVLGLAGLIGVAGIAVGLSRARDEARRAERSAALLDQSRDFMSQVFDLATPDELGPDANASTLLAESLRRLDAEVHEPSTKGVTRTAIAASLSALGSWQLALEQADAARAELLTAVDEADPLVIKVDELRAAIYASTNRLDDAEALLARVHERLLEQRSTTPAKLLQIERHRAIIARRLKRYVDAERSYRALFERVSTDPAAEVTLVVAIGSDLISLLIDLNQPAEALTTARAVQDRCNAAPVSVPATQMVRLMHNSAQAARACGDAALAADWHRRAVERGRNTMGLDHPDCTMVIAGAAESLCAVGEALEAEQLLTETIELVIARRGSTVFPLVRLLARRAVVRVKLGNRPAAEHDHRLAAELAETNAQHMTNAIRRVVVEAAEALAERGGR